MAKAKKSRRSKSSECCDHSYYAKKKMGVGIMLVLFGLIIYMGYGWAMALMVVGALIFLKGLLMKLK